MQTLLTILCFSGAVGLIMLALWVHDRRNPPLPPSECPVYDPAFARTGEYDPYWERR